MADICLLDKSVSDRIRSLQVITGIESVVKELIENSLDAGSTIIDIRLTEFGLEKIEVIDNGKGIRKCDLVKLGHKNYTSKIDNFDDLLAVKTYGYRGEAICALTNVSKLTIVTRNQSDPMGTRVELGPGCSLIGNTSVARETGTTITVTGLFNETPVRKMELEKNIRKQFSKVELLVESYGIISTNVKISLTNSFKSLTNTSLTNKKFNWCSKSASNLFDNLLGVFSKKAASSLIPIIHIDWEKEELKNLIKLPDAPREYSLFHLEGYLSDLDSCEIDRPQSRTYIFMNKRPCIYLKIAQIIKSIYTKINPAIKNFAAVLLITLPPLWTDINVSTDKRSVLIKHEKWIEEAIRVLVDLTLNCSLNVKSIKLQENPPLRFTKDTPDALVSTNKEIVKNIKFPRAVFNIVEPPAQVLKRKQAENIVESRVDVVQKPAPLNHHIPTSFLRSKSIDEFATKSPVKKKESPSNKKKIDSFHQEKLKKSFQTIEEEKELVLSSRTSGELAYSTEDLISDVDESELFIKHSIQQYGMKLVTNKSAILSLNRQSFKDMRIIGQFNLGFIIGILDKNLYIIDQHAADEKFNYELMCANIKISSQKLMNPEKMNLDFGDQNIFKENMSYFESCGYSFHLTDSSVNVISCPFLYDELCFGVQDIYDFISDKRIVESDCNEFSNKTDFCCSLPFNNNPQIGYSILNSLKLKHIIASRACRSSIMIGTSLTQSTMNQVVERLSELDQPWNCPHGRPTIRHLASF